MQNNAHLSETKEQRLRRFKNNHPYEVIDTITNSISNYFVNELKTVFDNPPNHQTALMFLGTHSIALILAHGFFNKEGEAGYKMFLKKFVDGATPSTTFSSVATEIHEWRNIIAHRWINVAGHEIGYDFFMPEGWKREGNLLLVNPKIYLEQFLEAFGPRGKVYKYEDILTTEDAWEAAKQRFISKYIEKA